MTSTEYSRRRNAIAPSWMRLASSAIRSLPALCRLMYVYSTSAPSRPISPTIGDHCASAVSSVTSPPRSGRETRSLTQIRTTSLPVVAVRRCLDAVRDPEVDGIDECRQQLHDDALVLLIERRQHPVRQVPTRRRCADAYAQPRVLLRPERGLHRLQAVVAAGRAARTHADAPEIQRAVIHDHQQVAGHIETFEIREPPERHTAAVHVCERLDEHHVLTGNAAGAVPRMADAHE